MIKTFAITLITLACLSAHADAAAVEQLPYMSRLSPAAQEDIRAKVEAAGGCNANVCFAIDGSGAIPPDAFEAQKNFLLDAVSILSFFSPVEVAAVQYATSVKTISRLTVDTGAFNLAVAGTKQLGGESFVVGGINACFGSLVRRVGEAIKIVLIGDGNSTIGSSASARAALFRRIGGEVCAVEAGASNHRELLAIAGGNRDNVLQVDNFFDAIALQLIVEKLVLQICKS